MRAVPLYRSVLALTVGTVAAGCLTAGCASADPPAPARQLPALCSAPRPPGGIPFAYNRDVARRARILTLGARHGGVTDFADATVDDVAALLVARYVSPDDQQNDSPDVWTIFRFQCRHPEVVVRGYAVDPGRPDYRVSIDGIEGPADDGRLVADARRLCADSDEPQFDGRVDCWWD